MSVYDKFVHRASVHPNMLKRFIDLGSMVYFSTFGSKLYGCDVAESDDDFRGIFIPHAKDFIHRRDRQNDTISTREPERKSGPQDFDSEFFSLSRYLEDLADGQTYALDMLFTPQHLAWRCNSTVFDRIWDNRSRLLTSKCEAGVGYAQAQANRYSVRGDRIDAVKAVMDVFENCARQYSKERLRTSMEAVGFNEWLATHPALHEHVVLVTKYNNGKAFEYLEVCGKSADLNASVGAAYRMFKAKLDEYGQRARQAYDAGGTDWKALYHAVRVGEEMAELLTTGHITLPRPEAQHLLAIRRGELSIGAVYEEIDALLAKVREAQTKSVLRAEADQDFIDEIVEDVYGHQLEKYFDWTRKIITVGLA